MVPQGALIGVGNLGLARIALIGTALHPWLTGGVFEFPIGNFRSFLRFSAGVGFRFFRGFEFVGGFLFCAFKNRVRIQHILDIFPQFDAIELQQSNGLLKLR